MKIWAKIGRGLPKKLARVKSVRGSKAHIEWNGYRDVIDGNIHIKHLSKKK